MPAPRMTTDEYLGLPEKVTPEELVYGFVRNAASPTPGHQWVLGRVFVELTSHADRLKLGRVFAAPLDVVLDREKHLIVQPDLLYVSMERTGMITDRVWGAPDLVVEVLSPKPRIGTLEERLGWFAQYGVRECWLIRHNEREVDVLEFEAHQPPQRTTFESQTPIRSRVLPAFSQSLEQILG